MFVPDFHKNQIMCNITVDNYAHMLEFVPDFYKKEKMCNNAVDTYPFTIKLVTECYKTQNCVRKLSIFAFLYVSLFRVDTSLKKYVIKMFQLTYLY